MIIDYAWGTPNFSALKSAGVSGVMRYISHDPGKDLDAAELRALRAVGIPVGIVFESMAGRALGGRLAGISDAATSKSRLGRLGLPLNTPVYFAVDFDATDSQKPQIAQYLRGAGTRLDNVGVYGGFWVVKYMFEHKVCKFLWQTYAWSGGHVHPAAQLYQYSNGHKLAGVSCDYNKALHADWGQSPRPKGTKPHKKVKPVMLHYVGQDDSDHFEQVGLPGMVYRFGQFARKGKFRSLSFTRQ